MLAGFVIYGQCLWVVCLSGGFAFRVMLVGLAVVVA